MTPGFALFVIAMVIAYLLGRYHGKYAVVRDLQANGQLGPRRVARVHQALPAPPVTEVGPKIVTGSPVPEWMQNQLDANDALIKAARAREEAQAQAWAQAVSGLRGLGWSTEDAKAGVKRAQQALQGRTEAPDGAALIREALRQHGNNIAPRSE